MPRSRYDLIVLGGGTAGLVSAGIAATAGARVALIERERTGGDCLWTGCVPSKTLIATARLAHGMRNADGLGLSAADPQVDLAEVMDRVHSVIASIEPEDSPERLRSMGVDVIAGEGSFRDSRTIAVDGRGIGFRAAIVASGSEPAPPPVEGLEGDDVSDTDTIWDVRVLPRRLIVLGGGPIGCELGQAFGRLGSEVVVVELGERLLPKEEPAASALIAARLRAEGVEVLLETKATAVRRGASGAELIVEPSAGGEARTVPFDRVLVAAGRRPRTAGIGLDRAGVEVDSGEAVRVDGRLRTTANGIYAAGDVTARLPFTHVAAHHARVATPNALFGARTRVDETIPWVTFTDPEVGRVGMTEAEARERWGERTRVARSDYAKLDRAITEGEGHGFALLIGDPRGRLVGATVAAPGGGEAVAELTARIAAGAKIDSLSTTVHAYPTLAEGPSRAADDYLLERYSKPRYKLASRALLAALRAVEAVRRR